jgi:hypothetical protein
MQSRMRLWVSPCTSTGAVTRTRRHSGKFPSRDLLASSTCMARLPGATQFEAFVGKPCRGVENGTR